MASVLESIPTDVVEGVVYTLLKEDILKLDQFESLGKQYARQWGYIDIHKPNGTILSGEKVFYYVAIARGTQHYTPSHEYLECLVQGAKEHSLGEQYIANLESIETDKTPM